MKATVVIPFRAGSKGVPGKNTKMFCGRPLWHWTWIAAISANCVDQVLVTTDDESVLRRARQGYEPQARTRYLRRPPELATDEAPLDAAIIDAIDQVGVDGTVVVLQPTVPLRADGLIDECVKCFWAFPAAGSLVSVNRLHFVWTVGGRLENGPRVNRQDMTVDQSRYHEDGSVFIVDSAVLRESGTRVVEPVILYETARTVDIDTMADFRLAEALFKREQE